VAKVLQNLFTPLEPSIDFYLFQLPPSTTPKSIQTLENFIAKAGLGKRFALDGMGGGASLVWAGSDSLYALRGEFLENEPLYDFWRYNLTADAWSRLADIPAYPHDGGVGGVGDGGSLLYIGFWMADQFDYIYALSGAYTGQPHIPLQNFNKQLGALG